MQVSFHKLIVNKKIWIYGIGVKGKRICRLLRCFKIDIEGIVVSSVNENMDVYMNVPVKEFSSLVFDENDLIVITVEGKSQEEIRKDVEQRNVEYVIWTSELLRDLWKHQEYNFENRIRGKKKLCMVLSGYKKFLWDNVYKRLEEKLPDDVEVCVCSAGKYVKELGDIARRNNWSYLSTEINSVSLIQNICISFYTEAEWIYKMDEDIFVTHHVFENLLGVAKEIQDERKYELGIVSALMPVNAIGYRYILEKYNKLQAYERRFGAALVGGNSQRAIENNPDASRFMWGDGGMPQLDELAKDMRKETGYQECTARLSIGFILFPKELWEKMQGFVVCGNRDLGVDEEDINSYCINNSRVMVVAINAVAGHFGFGKQTEKMKKYYVTDKDRF